MTMPAERRHHGATISDHVIAFGPFRFSLRTLTLTKDGQPVALGSRAAAILAMLAARPGETVSHEELMSAVWPDVTVIEENLRVQIAGLRRVLNDGSRRETFITNVAGRGYRFVADVEVVDEAPAREVPVDPWHGVPTTLVRLIGRAQSLEAVKSGIEGRRLTTVVGPGGIGKTTLALAAIRGPHLPRVWFVDLSSVVEPDAVAAGVASAVGVSLVAKPSLDVLVNFFRRRPGLLILDNCEHVIDSCAPLAEHLLSHVAELKILATSRDPLKVPGEFVHRLEPLELPPGATITLSEAQAYPSVELLIERSKRGTDLRLADIDAPALAAICRRLDGVPLAIELAAATVSVLGVTTTAELLRDRLWSLQGGRRTAPPRQQTLWATLNWSYGLLSATEQAVLRRIAWFNLAASFEQILVLCADLDLPGATVLAALVQLVEKSLVNVDVGRERALYSMLQTSRDFAREVTPPRKHARSVCDWRRCKSKCFARL